MLHNFQTCMLHKDSENVHEFKYHFQPLLHLDFGEISCKIVTDNDYLFAGNCIGQKGNQSEILWRNLYSYNLCQQVIINKQKCNSRIEEVICTLSSCTSDLKEFHFGLLRTKEMFSQGTMVFLVLKTFISTYPSMGSLLV